MGGNAINVVFRMDDAFPRPDHLRLKKKASMLSQAKRS